MPRRRRAGNWLTARVGRVVEIAETGRQLSLHRGFLVVSARGAAGGGSEEVGRVALDGLAAVICNGHGLSYSNKPLLALAERNVATVLCGANHMPAALLWPVAGHHVQGGRMRSQVEARLPLRKRLWRQVVVAKIETQAAALAVAGAAGSGALPTMARRVRSGDPDNVEAQAARRYWPALLGADFRRDPKGDGANSQLNYGYANLRSGVARAVMAAGLHPSIGLHHANRLNPMCLVDDLMEPFRPVADLAVLRLRQAGHDEVTPTVKRALSGLLHRGVATDRSCRRRCG